MATGSLAVTETPLSCLIPRLGDDHWRDL